MLPNLILQRAIPATGCGVQTQTGCELRLLTSHSGARQKSFTHGYWFFFFFFFWIETSQIWQHVFGVIWWLSACMFGAFLRCSCAFRNACLCLVESGEYLCQWYGDMERATPRVLTRQNRPTLAAAANSSGASHGLHNARQKKKKNFVVKSNWCTKAYETAATRACNFADRCKIRFKGRVYFKTTVISFRGMSLWIPRAAP